ncbi:MAG: hypothetical protein AAGD35_11010 [Actinomycetota bacterium]
MATAADTESKESKEGVELIEPGALLIGEASGSTETSEEPVARESGVSTPVVIAGSIVAIVVALVVFSRPGPPVSVDDTDQTTVPVTTAPTTLVPTQTTAAFAPVTQAIPRFNDNVAADLPGVISSFDLGGSLIIIDRSAFRPDEKRLQLNLIEDGARSLLMFDGAPPIGVAQRLTFDGARIEVALSDDEGVNPTFRPADLAPDLAGKVLLVERGNETLRVSMAPVVFDDAGAAEAEILRWELPSQPRVLGRWGDELLIERAARTWLIDADLRTTEVAAGRVLAYDGTHLVRLLCDGPTTCSLAVGTPAAPDRVVRPLPEELAAADDDDWTRSIAVSPDGRRVAIVVRQGGLSLPMIVDLDTGATGYLADGVNHRSPVAWSPDGEWLAYLYTDDVMVWNLEGQRSWRVPVNRDLQSLLWRDRPIVEE